MAQKIPRDVWLVDDNPADVLRSDVVCGPSVAASLAVEEFSEPVGPIHMAATWAGAAGVSRVNEDCGDSREPGLVLDEGPELVEAPRAVDATLAATLNRDPLANTLQVFEGDSSEGVLGLRDQVLGDKMIHVSGESRFLSTPLLEQTFRGLGVLGLQSGSELGVSAPESVELSASPCFSVAVHRYVSDSEVDPKPIISLVGSWFGRVHHDCEIERSLPKDEVCLSDLAVEPRFLVGADGGWDDEPPPQGEYAHPVQALPAEYALVVDDGSMGLKGGLNPLVALVCFDDLADRPDGKLGGQAVLLPDLAVDEFLKGVLVGDPVLEGCLGNGVAGLVEPFHGLKKSLVLVFVGGQLHHQRLLHWDIDKNVQYLRVLQFLPPLKGVGFLEEYR